MNIMLYNKIEYPLLFYGKYLNLFSCIQTAHTLRGFYCSDVYLIVNYLVVKQSSEVTS